MPLTVSKWVLVKAICRNKAAVAITSPIYFGPAPAPLQATVSGKTAPNADIVVRAWGKDVGKAKAAADGSYRLTAPLAAHLAFSNGLTRILLFDDPGLRELHAEIYSNRHVGRPGSLANCMPADVFQRIRARAASLSVDAER